MDWVKEQLTNLKEAARRKGLSMRAACRLAGMPECTFSRWETKGINPTMKSFQKLSDAINKHKGD